MLRQIITNASSLLKQRLFTATTRVTQQFSGIANKQGLFGSFVTTNNSRSSFASNQRSLFSFSVKSNATTRKFSFFVYEETPRNSVVSSDQLPVGFAQVAQVQILHPEQAYKGGEDACFISKDKSVLGVFDGVRRFPAELGVDPRDYPVKLAEGCQKFIDNTNERDPKKILEAGYIEAKPVKGGSTACITVLNGNKINMANLGDSGMLIIRPPNTCLFRSKPQRKEIDFPNPYQLPHDSVDDAHLEEIKVIEGDIVILATDGVFDNVPNENLIAIVKQTVAVHKSADDLAHRVAIAISNQASLAAHGIAKKSSDKEPLEAHHTQGGELDDITVVVGIVGKVPVEVQKDAAKGIKKSKGRKMKSKNR